MGLLKISSIQFETFCQKFGVTPRGGKRVEASRNATGLAPREGNWKSRRDTRRAKKLEICCLFVRFDIRAYLDML
ncbi:hypothetical protein HanIR_Chr08g0377851 [Helianthus annuus]|nr:hypothetical protein HanIR_Chr08g0377851 [Helianthus annuus]